MASGSAASWLLSRERSSAGEAADGLGQRRQLVVGEPEPCSPARPPMASGSAAQPVVAEGERLQPGEAADGLGQRRQLVV